MLLVLDDPVLSQPYQRAIADTADPQEEAVQLARHVITTDPDVGDWHHGLLAEGRETALRVYALENTNLAGRAIVNAGELERLRDQAMGLDAESNPNVHIEEV